MVGHATGDGGTPTTLTPAGVSRSPPAGSGSCPRRPGWSNGLYGQCCRVARWLSVRTSMPSCPAGNRSWSAVVGMGAGTRTHRSRTTRRLGDRSDIRKSTSWRTSGTTLTLAGQVQSLAHQHAGIRVSPPPTRGTSRWCAPHRPSCRGGCSRSAVYLDRFLNVLGPPAPLRWPGRPGRAAGVLGLPGAGGRDGVTDVRLPAGRRGRSCRPRRRPRPGPAAGTPGSTGTRHLRGGGPPIPRLADRLGGGCADR